MCDLIQQTRNELLTLAESKFRDFSAKIIPGTPNIIGVRMPLLRKLGGKLAHSTNWREYLSGATKDVYHEELILQGLILSEAQMELEERFKLITGFIPRINNWSVCDSLCSGLKIARKYPARFWKFIQPMLHDQQEFHIRFGVVMLLLYYVNSEYYERTLALLDGIHHPGYYVKMGVAWGVSVCAIKYPEQTLLYLQKNNLDAETHNMALRKITDSFRVSPETKTLIRTLKR